MFSIIISAIIAACFIWFQWKYFSENKHKLKELKDLFPEKIDSYYLKEGIETHEICISRSAHASEGLKTLISELNEYAQKNVGTTDFAIIQNKTERHVKTQYDNATAKLAFPTYIGLMGTFVGVFLGLLFFSIGDTALSSDDKVYDLIHGVLVSMGTSFIGLLLTTYSNSYSADTKKTLDNRKNKFYDFIQNEMMPAMGTSMVVALTKLRETLGTFEPSFNRIIGNFKTTFDGCTSQFGEKFNVTVAAVTNAASVLGSSIEVVNDNVKHQRELLDEIRSGEMMVALNSFLEASDAFEKTTETLASFTSSTASVENCTNELVESMTNYNKSLEVPRIIGEKLNAILDRITTFEDSINNLGTAIDQTELLSNRTIASIEQHLESIKRKNDIAEGYADTEDELLKDVFEDHKKAIATLHSGYVSLLGDHQKMLEDTMSAVGTEVLKSKNQLITKLSDAFDLLNIKHVFMHLERLPEIKEKLDAVEVILSQLPPELANKIATYMAKQAEAIEDMTNLMTTQHASIQADTANRLGAINNAINNSQEKLTDSIDKLAIELGEMKESLVKLDNAAEDGHLNHISIKASLTEQARQIKLLGDTLVRETGKTDSQVSEITILTREIAKKVKELVDFNEENPAERLETGSIAKLQRDLDALGKFIEQIKGEASTDKKSKKKASSEEVNNSKEKPKVKNGKEDFSTYHSKRNGQIYALTKARKNNFATMSDKDLNAQIYFWMEEANLPDNIVSKAEKEQAATFVQELQNELDRRK